MQQIDQTSCKPVMFVRLKSVVKSAQTRDQCRHRHLHDTHGCHWRHKEVSFFAEHPSAILCVHYTALLFADTWHRVGAEADGALYTSYVLSGLVVAHVCTVLFPLHQFSTAPVSSPSIVGHDLSS